MGGLMLLLHAAAATALHVTGGGGGRLGRERGGDVLMREALEDAGEARGVLTRAEEVVAAQEELARLVGVDGERGGGEGRNDGRLRGVVEGDLGPFG